jgi:hypothetical protein
MAKVDFTKVEESLATALQTNLIKKIVLGEPTVSTEAVSYYRMDDGPRPKPIDPIIQVLDEIRKEVDELEEEARLALLAAGGGDAKTAKEETLEAEKTPAVIAAPEKVPTKKVPTFTPLFLLRQHLLWFKRKKIKDIFTTLGIQEQEIRDLRKKGTLSEEEQQKVIELLEKADDLRTSLIKKLGVEDDTVYIEKERKKHITKRFKVKETWLPMDTH